ncbi:heavy metal translocating P-type ATPase [Desulfosoma caldarium]|uniref:P-type Zn(2+) transporter n=1 Tax=Desulfosoma caldarium TaxID=610254 RepID=A0A3N1ULT6_9BACT|nr:heavy metal translocating P-type ATPase [Desulfosoma caldarium]ROQ92185.1 Cd2+/Zn2+-exporting ATPase [Desulfosoma caldarium]
MEAGQEKAIFEGAWYAYPPVRNALLAGLLTGFSFALAHGGWLPRSAEIAAYLVAMILGGYHWSREGFEELFQERVIGIEILMMAAAVGSAILGMWDEAAFLVFLYGTAEGLEELTYARTRAAIRKLFDLAPHTAQVLRDGQEATVPAQDLKVGDLFLVRPGENIATDGIIVEGRSSVNEAPVTGESMPVAKKEGMRVFAGTFNQEGTLTVQVTATFEDNTLAKMIHLVEEAQEQKGKAQLFIEKFGRMYAPFVLAGAVLLVVLPGTLGLPLRDWMTKAVVFLVAAAPCALVMSTPVAIAAGISKAGRSGVLIKGGVHLENLGKIKVVAFDKTGTLTRGEPTVTDVVPIRGDAARVLSLAYSVERFSEHPLAKAIVKKAEEMEVRPVDVTDFSSLVGYGARATVAGRTVYVGKETLLAKLSQQAPVAAAIEALKKEGKTVILVGTEDALEGLVAIRDEPRPEAKSAIEALHRQGFKVVMLTGDTQLSARALAKELGIDEVRADLKPEDKVLAVKELEKTDGAVAMVGDGINDAPALAQATVGVAMGTAGSDTAIHAADVALMADDLEKLAYATQLGRTARKIARQNIAFSLAILAVLIPAALAGTMSVALAVFVHESSELAAVANGLRVARS